MVRVLVADSSPVDVDTLIAILSADPEIEVIGVAATGEQAIDLVTKLKPDIVTISDSLESVVGARHGVPIQAYATAIKQIMAYNPTPILILTDPNRGDTAYRVGTAKDPDSVSKARAMGALDVIEKPTPETADALRVTGFVGTVKLLSKVKVVTHLAGKLERKKRTDTAYRGSRIPGDTLESRDSRLERPGIQRPPSTVQRMVAIAASTGGPSALAEVLRGLPAGSPIGIVIVQHVAEGFSAGLAESLDRGSQISVREAQDGDDIKLGYAFLAPTGFHMVVKACATGNRIVLDKAPPVSGHRPSADVLFTSVAETYGHNSIGVILTGMGSDGASGIVAIKNAGGRTIVQDKESCVVFGMPKAAIETGVVDEILPLDSIGERLAQLTMSNSSLEKA
jgi:two-component system chemotaxis response regulator CheB